MLAKSFAEKIEKLTVELTNVESVVGTPGELHIQKKIMNDFKSMDYYKKHPELLRTVNFPGDKLGRYDILAILKGEKGHSNKTVVLIGHSDTVGISDYGDLKEYATRPAELAERLKQIALAPGALKDLESGEWLWGRGTLDMKCGVATIMTILEDISNNIENLEGNIVFAVVGDEEGNSAGMIAAVPELVKMAEQEGFDYLAVIDTDYTASRYEGDEKKYIYVGTVGKLMPSFYIVGRESHVGQPYEALDANQLAAAITNRINLNVDFCDEAEGEVSLPPITLRLRDLKPEYSAQTTKTAFLYFNYATQKKNPDEVINLVNETVHQVFDEVVANINEQYQKYCEKTHYPQNKLAYKAKVITYQDLYNEVKRERGDKLDQKIETLTVELLKDESIDEREFSLRIVAEVHKLWSYKDPVIVTYFSPPYYPHIYVKAETAKEKLLLDAVNKTVEQVKSDYEVVVKKFYPYISDLSFVSAPKGEVLETIKGNMPALNRKTFLPLEDMQKLSLPVVNIGPFGEDAHKYTESLLKKYSFEVAPDLLYKTILNLLA